MFLEVAHWLAVSATKCMVVEDAVTEVVAARQGGFALVVGVDRSGNRTLLNGATFGEPVWACAGAIRRWPAA